MKYKEKRNKTTKKIQGKEKENKKKRGNKSK